MMQVISGTCYEHGDWKGPGMCPKCPKLTVEYPPTFEEGFRVGAEAMREAAAKEAESFYDPTLADNRIHEYIRALPLPEPPK